MAEKPAEPTASKFDYKNPQFRDVCPGPLADPKDQELFAEKWLWSVFCDEFFALVSIAIEDESVVSLRDLCYGFVVRFDIALRFSVPEFLRFNVDMALKIFRGFLAVTSHEPQILNCQLDEVYYLFGEHGCSISKDNKQLARALHMRLKTQPVWKSRKSSYVVFQGADVKHGHSSWNCKPEEFLSLLLSFVIFVGMGHQIV